MLHGVFLTNCFSYSCVKHCTGFNRKLHGVFLTNCFSYSCVKHCTGFNRKLHGVFLTNCFSYSCVKHCTAFSRKLHRVFRTNCFSYSCVKHCTGFKQNSEMNVCSAPHISYKFRKVFNKTHTGCLLYCQFGTIKWLFEENKFLLQLNWSYKHVSDTHMYFGTGNIFSTRAHKLQLPHKKRSYGHRHKICMTTSYTVCLLNPFTAMMSLKNDQ